MKKWKRRKLIIDFRLQLLILAYGSIMAAYGMIAVHINYQFMNGEFLCLGGYCMNTVWSFTLEFLGFLALAFYGLIFTNRIAGPLYRLELHMRKISEGEILPPLQLREKDHLLQLATTYNVLLKSLNLNEDEVGNEK